MAQAASQQIRTITEMVEAEPDVDVRESWTALWGILTEVKDRITAELPVERHASSADYDYYTAGDFEGSLTTWTGPEVEWFVHSWIGNRTASILDMNINVWLGQHIDVPHLCLVFGTVPKTMHRCGASTCWPSQTLMFMSRMDALRLPIHECTNHSSSGPV